MNGGLAEFCWLFVFAMDPPSPSYSPGSPLPVDPNPAHNLDQLTEFWLNTMTPAQIWVEYTDHRITGEQLERSLFRYARSNHLARTRLHLLRDWIRRSPAPGPADIEAFAGLDALIRSNNENIAIIVDHLRDNRRTLRVMQRRLFPPEE